MGSNQPWERIIYSVPTRVDTPIYRGVAVRVRQTTFEQLLDATTDTGQRAAQLVKLVSNSGLLTPHWSAERGMARFFAGIQSQGYVRSDHVIALSIGAKPPRDEDIEHDPKTLHHLDVQGYVVEKEVPLRVGSSVTVNVVEWWDPKHMDNSHFFHAGNGGIDFKISSVDSIRHELSM